MQRVAVAIISNDNGHILVGRRGPGTPLEGLREFPGGKLHPDESPEQCVVREVLEETGLTVRIERLLETVRFQYPHDEVVIDFFLCTPVSPAIPAAPFSWVSVDELDPREFPPANASVIQKIKQLVPPT